MTNLAFVNSKYINLKEASINIEDRGLQFADSIYEVIAIVNKKLIDLEFHFLRLKYSLKELNINYSVNESKLINIFQKLINDNRIKNGIVYLQITRGVQSRAHAYKKGIKPSVIIYSQRKKFNLPNKNYKGVKVITFDDLRWERKDIKTTNLLPNILAENYAHKKKSYTAILVKNNKITEGAHSNIWIIKNNTIFTHPANSDILKGVTRSSLKIIIKQFGLKLKEKSFTRNQLYEADEVFLTSAGSFVTPIIKVDSKFINNKKIGKITQQLAILYMQSF